MLFSYLTREKKKYPPIVLVINKGTNKLNNPVWLSVVHNDRDAVNSVDKVHEEAPTSTENLIKSQKAIAMKTQQKAIYF